MSEEQANPTATPAPAPTTLGEKILRLWQPRHPAFWMMMALNAATSALMWVSQTMPLATPARLVILGFAIGNFWLGIRCMRTLSQTPRASAPSQM